jgi:ABC-2 type transport system permease protein
MTSNRIARLWATFNINLSEFRRDPGALFLNFAFPLLFVVGLVVSNQINPALKFKFGVVDTWHNAGTRDLVQVLTATPSIQARSIDTDAVNAAIRDGEIHAAIVIPHGDFRKGREPVELVVSQRYEELARIMLDAARARLVGPGTGPQGAAPGGTPQGGTMRFEVTTAEGSARTDSNFVFPGILAMALLQLGLFATAVPLLQGRDRGTLRYLMLIPIRIDELLAGQLLLRVLIAIGQLALLLAAGATIIELDSIDWAAVLAVSCLGIVMLVSIGYAIAGMAPNLQTGMSMVMVANFTMLFGGTVFWDPKSSEALYVISHFVPLSYLCDMFRQVITGMSGLWPIWVDALTVLAWSAIAMLVAVKTFRFDTVTPSGRRLAES